MKKAILFVLTVISVLFLISCSKSDVMISGEWWTLLPDEAGSGSEGLVIQFNSAKSTVNFALKSLDNKSDKNYYIVESVVRKYTVENTGKGEGILRITDKNGNQWPELHISSLTQVLRNSLARTTPYHWAQRKIPVDLHFIVRLRHKALSERVVTCHCRPAG